MGEPVQTVDARRSSSASAAGESAEPEAAPLRELLRQRGYWQWLLTAQLVGLPMLMSSLGFVMAGTYATGSVAVGGLMVTVYVLALTFCAPFTGRLMDRFGPVTGAPILLGFAALALTGLAVAVFLKAAALPLLVLAGFAGMFGAGSSAAMRSLLNQVVPSRMLTPALAINSTVVEISVVSAPLIVALAAVIAPPGAVIAMIAATVLAAFRVRALRGVLTVPVTAGGVGSTRTSADGSLWRNRRFLFWMIVSVAFGHALGTAETGAYPLSTALGGGAWEAGLLIAALAVSSIAAGLTYAGLSHRVRLSPHVQASVLLALMVVACLGLGLADGWAPAAGAMVVLGLCTAPLNTIRSVAAEHDMPPQRRSEGFGTLFAANGVGFALGGLFLAVLPLSWMLLVGGGSALLALLLAPVVMRRRN